MVLGDVETVGVVCKGEASLVCIGREQGRSRWWNRLGERRKNKSEGAAAALGEGEERAKFFRVFLFCVASPLIAKFPPPNVLSCGPIFIGKILLEPQNWSLNFFFVNFDFSYFLYFLKTSNINVDSNEKNDA
jgi:hypothetical protein